jgi:predicted transcriptional regulator
MRTSVAAHLRQELECEALLECVHGLTELDRECYQTLVAGDEALTIDAVATRVERERSTAYRSVQRLLEAGFLAKDQVNYEQGGYYHVYRPVSAEEVTEDMQRMLNDWYAKMGQLIQEFETRTNTSRQRRPSRADRDCRRTS